MSELLREIEEDIRNEKLHRIWRSFGKAMVGASIAVILATIGYVWWQDRRESYAMEQTGQIMEALDRLALENYQGALQALAPITDDPENPYYSLAMLYKAVAEKKSGNNAAAQKTYETLASRKNDYARLAALPLASSAENASPYYATEREINGWTLLAEGKKTEALAVFSELRDTEDSPRSQRERLALILQHLDTTHE